MSRDDAKLDEIDRRLARLEALVQPDLDRLEQIADERPFQNAGPLERENFARRSVVLRELISEARASRETARQARVAELSHGSGAAAREVERETQALATRGTGSAWEAFVRAIGAGADAVTFLRYTRAIATELRAAGPAATLIVIDTTDILESGIVRMIERAWYRTPRGQTWGVSLVRVPAENPAATARTLRIGALPTYTLDEFVDAAARARLADVPAGHAGLLFASHDVRTPGGVTFLTGSIERRALPPPPGAPQKETRP